MSVRLDAAFVPVPAAGIEAAVLDDERVLWRAGRVFRIDAVASLVWGTFDGRSSVAALVPDLADAFGAGRDTVASDVLELCRTFLDEGLLLGGLPPPGPPLPARVPGPHVGPGRAPTGAGGLGGLAWAYESGRFRALDHDFAIRSTDAGLGEYFGATLRAFAADGPPARWYSVVDTGEPGPYRYETYLDGIGLRSSPDADVLVRHLLWHVNQEVLRLSRRHVLIHAGAVTQGGRAIVLPGGMNAGKSTLVAGLVREGFGYLTDELAAVDVGSGQVDPYPRPMNLGRGSWELVPEMQPPGRRADDPLPRQMWHVDVLAIRPDAVAERAPVGFVVAPRFEPGATARLDPMSRAAAVDTLHRNTMNREVHGVAAFRALVNAVRGARCATLVTGDLGGAVELVRAFVADGHAT